MRRLRSKLRGFKTVRNPSLELFSDTTLRHPSQSSNASDSRRQREMPRGQRLLPLRATGAEARLGGWSGRLEFSVRTDSPAHLW